LSILIRSRHCGLLLAAVDIAGIVDTREAVVGRSVATLVLGKGVAPVLDQMAPTMAPDQIAPIALI
jgi:hypothetical protein